MKKILLLLFFVCTAIGEVVPISDDVLWPIPPEPSDYYTLPCLYTIRLRHKEAKGIGYNNGYTSLDSLLFLRQRQDFLPFMDIRGHLFNNVKGAANVGFGFRYATESQGIAGFNVYYDYRLSPCDLNFSQVGLGLEWLSSRFDVRLNGYIPIDQEKIRHTCTFHYIGGGFIKHRFIEAALAGGDLELGGRAVKANWFETYIAAGGYYLGGEGLCCKSWGGKARINLTFTRYVSFEGSVSYDQIFKTRIQGQIAFSIPFGCAEDDTSKANNILSQPVERREIIALERYSKWVSHF